MSSPEIPSPPALHAHDSATDGRDLARWQRKLLPYMTRFLVILALGFFALTLFDVYQMQSFVKNGSTESALSRVEEVIRASKANGNPESYNPAVVVQQSLLLLEANAMDKRYSQASALLMSRIWTRQLAFLTGMVLAFIGAVFILGKLSEAKTDVSVGADRWKGAISSTSPGLILAAFGTTLIAISLIVQPKIQVQDRPIYFVTMGLVKNAGSQTTTQESKGDEDIGPINPGLDSPATKPK
jgi:hypothetical protein